MIKRALISVYDKSGILELVKFLRKNNVEIISTGGTFKYLKENNIEVTEISEITGSCEMLDGRVKTLHPIIHGGILAMRDNKEHMETLRERNIETIDMVVVNLYPFFEKVKEDLSFEEKVEFIDIGGPTMLRAAAKNFKDVVVLSNVLDYKRVINEIEENYDVSLKTRKVLAGKVFNLMSAYDAAISNFLLQEEEEYPEYLSVSYKKLLVFQLLGGNGLIGGNGNHLIDIVYGATARKVVHGAGNALEDRTDCRGMVETLHEFVTDVAHFEVGHYEHVSLAGNSAARCLGRANGGYESGICLQFAVDAKLRIHFVGDIQGLNHLVYNFMLGTALGGEAQHGHTRLVDTGNGLCGAGGANGNLCQLVGIGHGRYCHVAHHEHAVLSALGGVGEQ